MQSFSYHAARAVCRDVGERGVVVADYTGPLCLNSMSSLRREVLDVTKGAKAMVIHIEKALLLMEDFPKASGAAYSGNDVPGCIIVRPDQFNIVSAQAADLARYGVTRVVFLESQIDLAMLWAEQRAKRRALPLA